MKLLLFLCFIAFVFELHAMDCAGVPDIYAIMRKSLFYETAESRIVTKQNLNSRVVREDKTTLLQYFAHCDAAMVKRLLEAGATPSPKILYSALLHSHRGPGLESAQELLKHCPSLAHILYEESTFLQKVCAAGDGPSWVASVKLLLSYKSNPNHYSGWSQTTPLYYLIIKPLPTDQNAPHILHMKVVKIKQRKQIIHELIFHGAQLKTTKISPDFLPTNLVNKDSEYYELAQYAERKYVLRMLKLMRKTSQDNLVKLLPDDVIKYISQKA